MAPQRPARLLKLEALRGFAAAYVTVGHITNDYLGNPTWAYPLRFAQSAVMLFFILSGFVICYSTGYVPQGERPPGGFRDYFIKRARRIYPLFITAMIAGYLADCAIGRSWLAIDWKQVIGNLLMLQDAKGFRPGVWFDAFHNNPLWSLAYEWWYYMLFYALLIWNIPWWVKKYIVCGLSLAGLLCCMFYPLGPAVYMLLFPIWWAGAEMAREYQETGEITLERQAPMIVFLTFMTAVFVAWWRLPEYHAPNTEQFEKGEVQHFGAAMLLIPAGIIWRAFRWRGFSAVLGWFVHVAPISYAIYVFHIPIIGALKASPAGSWTGIGGRIGFIAIAIALILVFSYLMEVRVQAIINRATKPLLRGRG